MTPTIMIAAAVAVVLAFLFLNDKKKPAKNKEIGEAELNAIVLKVYKSQTAKAAAEAELAAARVAVGASLTAIK